uniref:Uncharacterized protein n=1 Tax=Siphoviridae sp. ctS2049 TaxID=2825507 RepID=A0A8S5V8L3_9CAUD|nr:MAG TPA: hypothetical protein [Siphoviridae sp. ctS2049]
MKTKRQIQFLRKMTYKPLGTIHLPYLQHILQHE